MAFYKYENTELLNIVSSNLVVRRAGITSNIIFELPNNNETRIGMIIDDQFRGFMSNVNGVFFANNSSAGFKRILGPGDISITATAPLSIISDNLGLGYDTNQFTLTGLGSNLLGLTTGGIQNSVLANSNIIIDSTTLELGGNYSGLALDLTNSAGLPFTGLTGNINPLTQIANVSITGDKLVNSTITNNLLANSGITVGDVIVALGGAIYSIPMSNITGTLPATQLPTDFENIALSQVVITSGNLTTTNLATEYIITQTANITDKLWLGGLESANISLINGGWWLTGANLGLSDSGNLDIGGNLWVGGNGAFAANISTTNMDAVFIGTTNLAVQDTLITQSANITDRIWLGGLESANLSLVDGGWLLTGANLGLSSGQTMDVGGNLWVGGSAYITGNMTVYGETTIINSNVVTVLDPVITLSGNTAPSLDDGMDRGVAFRWFDSEVSTAPRLGFMGFRDSDHTFRFIPDATDTNQVFTGANGSAGFDALSLDSNITLLGTDSVIGWGSGASSSGIRLSGANLEVKSNSTAAWQRLFAAQELTNGVALAKSGVDNLTLDVQYDNTSIGINGSGQLALVSGGVANSNLANSNIGIGGTTYELGTQTTNLALLGSNSLVFGGQPNNFMRADDTNSSNLLVSSAGNLNISVATESGGAAATGVITMSANAGSTTAADVLFTGPNAGSGRIGITLTDSSNSIITMGGSGGGTGLGTAGYGFRSNTGIMYYRNSADSDWTQLVSLKQIVAGAGVGFDTATNTLYTLTDNTTIETASTGTANLQVKDGGLTGIKLANSTITNDKLANTTITISGVGYALGSSTTNLSITGSNAILFGTGANITIPGGMTGNLAITASATGNVSIGKHLIAANTFTTAVYSNSALTNMSGTQTLALDFGEASSFLLTLAANADVTLSNPANANRVGQQGIIYVQTPSTGSGHILRWYKSSNDSSWFFPGGSGGFAPSISVANSVYDVFNYVVLAASPSPVVLVTDATGFSRYN